MSGNIYEEIKKNNELKTKDKLKFITTIISSNLFVAILCYSLFSTNNQIEVSKPISKIIHPHYKMIILPLTVLIEIDPLKPEIPISLMNKSKKVLISHAYLHEAIPVNLKEVEGPPRFKIEIPDDELMQISADQLDAMIAIPELKNLKKDKHLFFNQVSQYEINL